ncbi:MAG: 4'-phosphopantetheinyl transferase superfamily protein [Gemmatimonadetes bacterium]|nr:4'-phosphopantetheinyl transferase superfamily protein [Gemmatimonadota bacterium]
MTEEPAVHLIWATVGEVPAVEGWLTDREAEVYRGLSFSRRAADWRLGRWVAKGAVAAALDRDAAERRGIEVLASPGGAPVARVVEPGSEVHVAVSLSHCGGLGFAAATHGRLRLGCDVEAIEPRSEEFVRDYFTADEQRWILAAGADASFRANLLWSAKESALKALGEGLRMDTRSVEVEAVAPPGDSPDAWRPLAVEAPGGTSFPGLWRTEEGRVWTVVAERPFRLA